MPGAGSVGLFKSLKNLGELVRRNANASVPDREAEDDVLCLLFFQPNRESYFTTVGKLDGISDQADKDLAQASRIAKEPLGHSRANFEQQFESFLVRAKREGLHALGQSGVDGKITRIQSQPASLNL